MKYCVLCSLGRLCHVDWANACMRLVAMVDGRQAHAINMRSNNFQTAVGVVQIQNEIISSEETYVKELRTLVTVFLRPLEKWVAEGVGGLPIAAGAMVGLHYDVGGSTERRVW